MVVVVVKFNRVVHGTRSIVVFFNEGIISTKGSTITLIDKEKLKLISANG